MTAPLAIEPMNTRWLRATFVAILAGAALAMASAAGPISKADAAPFCSGVTLQPYGAAYDRCYAPVWEGSPHLDSVTVNGWSRSGCVSYTDGSGVILSSWSCSPAGVTAVKFVPRNGVSHRGVIRNNNTQYSGTFWGTHNHYQ
jgi:hypothetical protein